MRRPERNIEIFSMSVLDMFASALGAFILIAVILFPYYNAGAQVDVRNEDATRIAEELTAVEAKIAALEKQEADAGGIERCETALRLCRETAGAAFLVVVIEWSEHCDVDLHVRDPDGHQFYYGHANRDGTDFPGADAQLSIDMRDGPGAEMWVAPKAAPGIYDVFYRLGDGASCPAAPTIRGWVIDRDAGLRALPEPMTATASVRPAARLKVAPDGGVTILAPERGG